jgi:hypothetical protein
MRKKKSLSKDWRKEKRSNNMNITAIIITAIICIALCYICKSGKGREDDKDE